jgi:bifunctional DNA-binding transcriptional regulator/antitoxin component of YhaV-PrlF toxin-antitoxin module
MLAKLTAKNQITIPKDVISRLPNVEYFDVSYKDGRIILKPLKVYETDLEGIRSKMKQLGISENSVGEAVKWAREK